MIKVNYENPFYRHRMEIKEICEKRHCDVGVGTVMWACKAGDIFTPEDYQEWCETMTAYQVHKTLTLADLFQ